MKELLKYFSITLIPFVLAAGIAFGAKKCNSHFNNKKMENFSFSAFSYPKGIAGHIEFTQYKDGSKDVKIYPGFSSRLFPSEFYQDLNGDGLVERIRQNNSEWKMYSLKDILVRDEDYLANKEKFDEADKIISELMKKD